MFSFEFNSASILHLNVCWHFLQDLKSNLATMKSGMEHIKLQYSEDLDKLGKLNSEFQISIIFSTILSRSFRASHILSFLYQGSMCTLFLMRLLGIIKFLRKTVSYTTKYKILEVPFFVPYDISNGGLYNVHASFMGQHNMLIHLVSSLPGNIRVYCRVRPFLPGKVSSSSSVAGLEDRTITVMTPSKHGKDARKSFTFNRVFGPLATQGCTYNLWYCTISFK